MYTMSFKFNGLEKSESQLDRQVLDAEKRLKYKMLSKSGFSEERCARAELVKLFNRYDKGEVPGKLTLQEFINALSEHSMADMDDVVTALFHRYDTDDSGLLDYEEFTKGLYGIVPVPAASEECRSLCRRISRELTAQGGGGNRALILSLRSMDQDGNGVLSPTELCSGFEKHGITLADDEWNIVRKYFDRNLDGKISIEEVSHTLRGDMGQWRTQLVKYAFAHVDADGSGSISFSELKQSYRADLHPSVQACEVSEDDCLAQFIDSWAKDMHEYITEGEFIDYYKDISLEVPTDDQFLALLKQSWRTRPGEEKLSLSLRLHDAEVTFDDGSRDAYKISHTDLLNAGGLTNRAAELELRKQGLVGIQKVRLIV